MTLILAEEYTCFLLHIVYIIIIAIPIKHTTSVSKETQDDFFCLGERIETGKNKMGRIVFADHSRCDRFCYCAMQHAIIGKSCCFQLILKGFIKMKQLLPHFNEFPFVLSEILTKTFPEFHQE